MRMHRVDAPRKRGKHVLKLDLGQPARRVKVVAGKAGVHKDKRRKARVNQKAGYR